MWPVLRSVLLLPDAGALAARHSGGAVGIRKQEVDSWPATLALGLAESARNLAKARRVELLGTGGHLGREAAIGGDCLKRVLDLEDAATAMSAFSARVLC